jgi:hypothetical protein
MQVGNEKIPLAQIHGQILQAGGHRLPAFLPIHTRIDHQTTVIPFDDVGVNGFQGISRKGNFHLENIREYFFNHM